MAKKKKMWKNQFRPFLSRQNFLFSTISLRYYLLRSKKLDFLVFFFDDFLNAKRRRIFPALFRHIPFPAFHFSF